MEKRTLMDRMELRQRITISAPRWWLIVVSVVMAAVFCYIGARSMPRADPAHANGVADQLAQEPRRPLQPLGPYTVYTMLLSATIGLVISASARLSLELTTLGSIPSPDVADYPSKLVVSKLPHSRFAEAYRVLHTNLQPQVTGYPLHTLLITSSASLEGKSATAANLAAIIAQSGQRVILVDADLRHPVQHRIFELDNNAGLVDALRGQVNLAEMLQSVPVENLRVLPSGSPTPTDNLAELLDYKRMRGLIESLHQQADVVIVDHLPIAGLPDAKTLAVRVGGALLVIDSTRVPRGLVQRSRQALDKLGAHLSGASPDYSSASSEDYCYYRYYSGRGQGAVPSAPGLPAYPSGQTDLAAVPLGAAAIERLDQGQALDTRHIVRPPALDLLRARVASVARRMEARNTLGIVLLAAAALVILATLFVSSLSRQLGQGTVRETTRPAGVAQTVSVEAAKANQTSTAIAKERESVRQTQTALAGTVAAGATATQQALYPAGQRPGGPECETIEFDILQSPTGIQTMAVITTNVELTWRVMNRATSPNCTWGQAGQETKLLRAVEVGGQAALEVPVRLRWIQGDEYDLLLSVPLSAGEHDLIWRLTPPGSRLPRGPDLLAKVVVATPTIPPSPTQRPAPTACPIETYPCNCSKECDPRSGCQTQCDTCTRPKCD